MENSNLSVEKTAFRAGVIIFLVHVAYFLVMKFAGLIYISELRVLNFLIQLFGIIFTLKYFKVRNGRNLQYLQGFNLGVMAAGVSVALFAVFVFFYFLFDPVVLEKLKEDAPIMGKYLSPFTAGISVLAEGMISALILSFAMMQYYKDDSIHSPYKRGPESEEA